MNQEDWGNLGEVRYGRLSRHRARLTHHRFEESKALERGLCERLYTIGWITRLLQNQVQLPAAEQMYLRALAGIKKALGEQHPKTVTVVRHLTLCNRQQSKVEAAE